MTTQIRPGSLYACPTCPVTVTVHVPVTAVGHSCSGRSHMPKDKRVSIFLPIPTRST